MGVWITPYAMAAEGKTITHDDFVMMVLRVLHADQGHAPVIVASGHITHEIRRPEGIVTYLGATQVPSTMTTFPAPITVARYDLDGVETGESATVTIWYRGANRDMIARALYALPYGQEDIWVKFDGTWSDPEFYALTTPRTIAFWNAWGDAETYATTAHLCELAGEKGREPEVDGYAISAILTEYYGQDIHMGYTYS